MLGCTVTVAVVAGAVAVTVVGGGVTVLVAVAAGRLVAGVVAGALDLLTGGFVGLPEVVAAGVDVATLVAASPATASPPTKLAGAAHASTPVAPAITPVSTATVAVASRVLLLPTCVSLSFIDEPAVRRLLASNAVVVAVEFVTVARLAATERVLAGSPDSRAVLVEDVGMLLDHRARRLRLNKTGRNAIA